MFDFLLECPELAGKAKPGQFAQIYLPGHTLRRPISICEIDKKRGVLPPLEAARDERDVVGRFLDKAAETLRL